VQGVRLAHLDVSLRPDPDDLRHPHPVSVGDLDGAGISIAGRKVTTALVHFGRVLFRECTPTIGSRSQTDEPSVFSRLL